MQIFLEFTPSQTDIHRCRMQYSFCLFCAIYGHEPIFEVEKADKADARISYSENVDQRNLPRVVQLSNLYMPRSTKIPAPPPQQFETDDAVTVLFNGRRPGEQPDWLGEIFEWVSCADEYSVVERDAVGRIPFAKSYHGRHGLDPRIPYAAIAMRALQRALCSLLPAAPTEPVSPISSMSHFVVNTHDVDFLRTSFGSSMRRLTKNALISLLLYRSPRLAAKQANKTLRMALGGEDPLDQLAELAQEEVQRGVNATYFFIPRRHHRRDSNYWINHPKVVEAMHSLERQGMEIGVHGSYTSMDEPKNKLSREFARLREQGFRPVGNRQHWLRFTLDRIIPAVQQAEGLYDTSLGWPDTIGFRAGACFAFPPYDFERERPAGFLEIPLVVMESSLQADSSSERDWYDQVDALLCTSRRFGWGGISLLWHPSAFGAVQLPEEIGNLFWRLLEDRSRWKDSWLSGFAFVRSVWQRYSDAGLLPAAAEVRE